MPKFKIVYGLSFRDPSRYPSQVFWSDEDQGFIAIALDLPGCTAFGITRMEAAVELEYAIVAWIKAARAAGNPVPAPSVPAAPDRPCVNQAHDDRGYLLAEVERLRAENEKLRASLKQFRCSCDPGECVEYGERWASVCEKGEARDVLERKP